LAHTLPDYRMHRWHDLRMGFASIGCDVDDGCCCTTIPDPPDASSVSPSNAPVSPAMVLNALPLPHLLHPSPPSSHAGQSPGHGPDRYAASARRPLPPPANHVRHSLFQIFPTPLHGLPPSSPPDTLCLVASLHRHRCYSSAIALNPGQLFLMAPVFEVSEQATVCSSSAQEIQRMFRRRRMRASWLAWTVRKLERPDSCTWKESDLWTRFYHGSFHGQEVCLDSVASAIIAGTCRRDRRRRFPHQLPHPTSLPPVPVFASKEEGNRTIDH
jgi:hypothetical protein